MKKYFLAIITILLVLTACNDNSLNSFVKDFNQSARKYDAIELVESEFGEIEEEDGERWRSLFKSKEYEIEAMYDGKKVSGYYINVNSDTNSILKDSKGYNAVLTLADALDLDIKDLEKGMQEAFNENFYDYEDEYHNIKIRVINITSASMSITIEDK